jgi:hypothetical protein
MLSMVEKENKQSAEEANKELKDIAGKFQNCNGILAKLKQ